MKLAKIAVKEVSEVTWDEKKKRSTIEREKRKMVEKLKEKERREKSRLLSKKKLKDEFPELYEIEERFFEIVKKVISFSMVIKTKFMYKPGFCQLTYVYICI